MPGEWKAVNRRNALGHAMDLAQVLVNSGINIGNASDEVVTTARKFEAYLNGDPENKPGKVGEIPHAGA